MAAPWEENNTQRDEVGAPWEQAEGKPAPAKEPAPWESQEQDKSGTGSVNRAEIASIAAKHSVDPNRIDYWAPLMGVSIEGSDAVTDILSRAGGLVSEGALMGAPEFLYKKLGASDKEAAALDDLRSLVEERKTTPTRLAELGLGIATPIPGTGVGKALLGTSKLAKVGAAAGHGALIGGAAGLFQSKEGDELSAAGMGAAGGAAIGSVLGAATASLSRARIAGDDARVLTSRVNEQAQRIAEEAQVIKAQPRVAAHQETILSHIQNLTKEGEAIPQASAANIELARKPSSRTLALFDGDAVAAKEYIAQKSLERETKDFASFVAGKTVSGRGVEKTLRRLNVEGPEYAAARWDEYVADKALTQLMKRGIVNAEPNTRGFLDRAMLWVSDARNGASQIIDNRLPTSVETTLDSGEESMKIYLSRKYAVLESMKDHLEKAGKWDDQTAAAVYDAATSGRIAELPESLRVTTTAFMDKFKELGAMAKNEFGTGITLVNDYLPMMTKDAVSTASVVSSKWTELGQDIARLRSEEGKPLREALEYLSGRKIETSVDAEKALATATNPVLLSDAMGTKARFFFAREGEVPALIQEKNPARLLQSWTNSSFKHLYMRDTLAALRKDTSTALRMGDKNAAAYLSNLIKDVGGIRRGTAAAWSSQVKMNWQVRMMNNAASATSDMSKKYYKFLAAAPEASSLIMQQIYPSFLGLSPKAIFQNLTQPILMTVPELGWGYGSQKLLQSYAELAKMGIGAGTRAVRVTEKTAAIFGLPAGSEVPLSQFTDTLLKTGKTARRFNQEVGNELALHLQKYSIYNMSRQALDTANNFAMKGFEGAETINRMTTVLMAARVAEDFMGKAGAGKQAATLFVNNMGSAYQRAIAEAASKADGLPEVTRLMSNYLLGKTMFNYSRLTMSEYGRFMGPMLSIFTKWPTSIAGDILQEYTKRGAIGGTQEVGRKYLAPLALLYLAGHAAEDYTKDNPWAETVLGKQGLEGLSPLASAKGILTGEAAAPPAVTLPRDIVLGAATGDLYKIYRAANDTFTAFTPVVPMLARVFVMADSLVNDTPTPRGTLLNKVAGAMGAGEPDKAVRDFSTELRDTLIGK